MHCRRLLGNLMMGKVDTHSVILLFLFIHIHTSISISIFLMLSEKLFCFSSPFREGSGSSNI